MAKKNQEELKSKSIATAEARTAKGIKDAKLGGVAMNAIVDQDINDAKKFVSKVALAARIRIKELEEATEKAKKIKPDNVNFTEDGVRAETYTAKAYAEKQKPFKALEVLVEAFDKAITSDKLEDFEAVEKILSNKK